MTSDPVEEFTRTFVKAFGPFRAESWTEAVSTGITVRTAGVNSLEIVAEVGGTRYLFADLGHIEGDVAIPINIPNYVKEVILVVDGEREIKAAPGATVKLDNGASRSILHSNYGSIDWKLTVPDFAPNMEPGKENTLYRKVKFTGSQINKALWENKYFLTGKKENFDPSIEKRFYGSKYQVKKMDKYAVTVYPLYWQTNRYNESDYLVGVYFFKGSGETASKIEMHDLFMVKDRMTLCDADGQNEGPVNAVSPFTQGSLTEADNIASTGYTVTFDNGLTDIYYGFYVKSGLKETSREGFGRECDHISFQDYRYNSHEWGSDNAWAVNMEYFDYSYSGCASASGAIIPSSSLTHLDPTIGQGLTSAFSEQKNIYNSHGTSYNILGFTAPPSGYDRNLPDFSDCVLMIDTYGEGGRRELPSRGEGISLFPWYLAAEDLGGSEDWDFNDLIVTIYDVTTDLTKKYCSSNGYYPVPSIFGRRIVVEPVATGATLPVYLMYEGAVATDIDMNHNIADLKESLDNFRNGTYVIGTEIHKWLGSGDDYTGFINVEDDYTDASPRGRAVSFLVPVVKDANGDAVVFDPAKMPQIKGEDNQPLRGFWVLVDKNNSKSQLLQNPNFDVTPIPPMMSEKTKGIAMHHSETEAAFNSFFSAKLGEGVYRVDAPINDKECFAPQMLMCHFNWQWCKERQSIEKVYTSFTDWVAGIRTTWHNNPNLEEGEGLNGYFPDKVCKREKTPTFIQ
ncbi:MAG: hypothetical protein K2K05_08070 [Muribaculaceae bacterium]|nr:hypothetical protein [Muribaculaceae bacterium]